MSEKIIAFAVAFLGATVLTTIQHKLFGSVEERFANWLFDG